MSIWYHGQVVAGPGGISREELEAALAGKQDKLRGCAGQAVGFDASGAAAAVQGWSNPTLLDNGYFADPVNQRGQTKYNGIGYTIDRWAFGNEKSSAAPTIELLDDCIFIQTNTSDAQYHYFIQKMELDAYRQYRGKTITVSLLAKGAGTLMLYGEYIRADGTLFQKSSVRALSDDYDVYTLTYAIPDDLPSDIECAELGCFQLVNGAGSIYAKAMKVELGARQTLAHQDGDGNWVLNDPPPNKALELAKCQRYAANLVREEAAGDFLCVGNGLASETDLVPIFIPLPVPLRGAPSVSFSGDWRLVTDRYWEQGVPVAGLSHAYLAGNGVTVWARCAANSISIGKTYYLCGTGSSQKSLLLSSDL